MAVVLGGSVVLRVKQIPGGNDSKKSKDKSKSK